MAEEQTIKDFFEKRYDPSISIQGTYSCFYRALYEARKTTGRELDTGIRNYDYDNSNWLGAIGYMSLLDMIGDCFRPKSTPELKKKHSIIKALSYFSKTVLSDKQKDALYALRCAFMHNFSLINKHNNNKSSFYNFVVRDDDNDPVVVLPKKMWDGRFESRSEENQTIVYLEIFGDIVEDVCKTVITLAKDNKLAIALDGGVTELNTKYKFTQSIRIRIGK